MQKEFQMLNLLCYMYFEFSAATGGIAVALIGLLGTAITALIQARSKHKDQTEADKRKLESDLILQSIRVNDPAVSSRNLTFLVNIGYLTDPNQKIAKFASDVDSVAFLPGPTFEGIPPEGVGGDPEENILRNRMNESKSYKRMTLDEIIALPVPKDDEKIKGRRTDWAEDVWEELNPIEHQGVVVEGYV